MGEVFAGRYELLDPLGEGGMGSVWRAHDRKRDQVVAVKVLRQADAGSLMRFMREQAMRIHHPHVLTPLGWAGEDDRVLFAMPLVTGGSVATLVGDYGPLPPRFAAELLRQLLAGLQAVHARRVVHRDVKPANLLLTPTGTGRPHLLLSDFGIAVPQDEPRITRPSMVIGTPGYLAPEQLWGADPDPRADLYAAGVVAAEMLTGERPATSPDGGVVVPALPADTPSELRRLVADLTAPEPAGRPSSAAEALARLQGADLAWPEGGQDEIEVFDHAADASTGLPGVAAVVATPPGEPAAAVTEVTAAPATEALRSAPTAPEGMAPAVAGPGIRTGGAGATPVAGHPRGRRVPWPALAMFAAAAVVALATLVLALQQGSGSGGHGTPPTGAPAAGDTCLFSDVGQRELARDGSAVVCGAEDDGSYRWRS